MGKIERDVAAGKRDSEDLLAIMVSGENEDGTAFALPVENVDGSPIGGGGGATGTLVSVQREEFTGAAINTDRWTQRTLSGGATATVAGSELRLDPGATNGADAEFISDFVVGVPCRAVFIWNNFNWATNRQIYVELVEDGAVAPAHPTTGGGTNKIGLQISSSVTNAYSAGHGDITGQIDLANLGWSIGMNRAMVVEIELTPTFAYINFYQGTSTTDQHAQTKVGSFRLNRKLPDPTKQYAVRVRATNTGASAAGNYWPIDAVVLQELAHNEVILTHGIASQSTADVLPVQNIQGPAAASSGTGAVTVGTSSVSVRNALATRKLLALFNDSANTIYVALGGTATLNQGIRLNANGGMYELPGSIYTGAVSAIATGAGSVLTFVEV
jgi:hypothetical protein